MARTSELRASVLDAALLLGVGTNAQVTNWIFNSPLEEEDEDVEEDVEPELTSASTSDHSHHTQEQPRTPDTVRPFDAYVPPLPDIWSPRPAPPPPPPPLPPPRQAKSNKLRKKKRTAKSGTDDGRKRSFFRLAPKKLSPSSIGPPLPIETYPDTYPFDSPPSTDYVVPSPPILVRHDIRVPSPIPPPTGPLPRLPRPAPPMQYQPSPVSPRPFAPSQSVFVEDINTNRYAARGKDHPFPMRPLQPPISPETGIPSETGQRLKGRRDLYVIGTPVVGWKAPETPTPEPGEEPEVVDPPKMPTPEPVQREYQNQVEDDDEADMRDVLDRFWDESDDEGINEASMQTLPTRSSHREFKTAAIIPNVYSDGEEEDEVVSEGSTTVYLVDNRPADDPSPGFDRLSFAASHARIEDARARLFRRIEAMSREMPVDDDDDMVELPPMPKLPRGVVVGRGGRF